MCGGNLLLHHLSHPLFSSLFPLSPLQKIAAQSERSCPVTMISLDWLIYSYTYRAIHFSSCMISLSGGTAGQRNIFPNSRTKGAPVTVFVPVTVFRVTVISCVFVGIGLLGTTLVDGLPVTGASSHFSICSIDCARFIEMIIATFMSPLEFSSHHFGRI